MARETKYLIYIGDDLQGSDKDLNVAKALYKSLPSGKGKSWTKRRALLKATTILEDEG